MREFHKTHPSRSGTVTKTTPSVTKIKPSATSKGTGVKPRVPDVPEEETSENNEHESDSEHETNKSESSSESDHNESEENEEDDEDETKTTDKVEGDEDEEMDFTTSRLYDDVDIRLIEPVDTDEGFVQEIFSIQMREIASLMDVYIQHEVPSQQTPTLLTVPVSVISDSSQVFSTVILKSLQSFTSPPQQSTSTPSPTTEAINHLSTLSDFADEFINFLSASITARITEHVKNQLPQILPKEVSNFAPPATATLTEFELKKILIDKMDKSKSYLAAPEHRECYEGLKKYYDLDKTVFSTYGKVYSLKRSRKDKDKDEDPFAGLDRWLKRGRLEKMQNQQKSEEPEFEVADDDIPHDQEGNPGPAFRLLKGTRSNYTELEYDFEECYKALSEKLDWENPEGGDYPFDLTNPLPLVNTRNRQKVNVIKKHGYGYLPEIVVRRANNELYRFKEGDFQCLRINDIEDMLLLVV
nr:hypothetical protein [Tanacetum cinerariifolium]